MPPRGYTEDALVEQPAIALLAELGWETKDEVILVVRLRPVLRRLNPEAPNEAIEQAIEELTRDRSRMSLAAEEQRAVGEQLSEEELALFDLLTKPRIEMSDADRKKVKAVARELLSTLKEGKLVLDWRKRQQARAEVRVTIEKLLDKGLPRAYTLELFQQKATAVFQHVYDAYYGAGQSIYAAVAQKSI